MNRSPDSRMSAWRSATVLLVILVVSSCGGSGTTNGGLAGNIGLAQADCIIVNLTTGAVVGCKQADAPDLSDDSLRIDRMLFIALPAGSVLGGSPVGTRWGQPDETVGTVSAGHIFVSVFTVTRGQWQRLSGTTPWTRLPVDLGGVDDERLPACGLSLDLANTGCATGSARIRGSFRLLTSSEWEYACRAGTTTRFSWGEATDSATVGMYAQVAETTGANPGPQRVGSLLPNAFGLYDMAGGVWQLTSDGLLRGGSWRDSLPMARSANRIAIDPSTPHGLVGLRLVFKPDGS